MSLSRVGICDQGTCIRTYVRVVRMLVYEYALHLYLDQETQRLLRPLHPPGHENKHRNVHSESF